MVQRSEVPGMQQLSTGPSRAAQVVQRAVEQPIVDNSSDRRVQRILSGLAEFTDTASQASFRQAQLDVESKKVDGMAKAVSGGKLGEEASKAEQMGYDIVQSQSELAKINEDLANAITANPNMADDEFSKLRDSQYQGLMSKYQDRAPEVFKAISVKAQESQIALHRVKTSSQERYRKEKGAETLNYNIGSTLDSASTVEQGVGLVHQFMAQGTALGLNEFETKSAILEQMKLTASQGDNRLLKFVQGTDWGKYTPESKQAQGLYKSYVKQAQSEYEAAQQKQNVFAYGSMLADLEIAAKSGAPREQMVAMMQKAQASGLKMSPSAVANYLTMGTKVSQSQIDLSNNVNAWQSNRGNFNLATNPYIAAGDKTKVLDAAEGAIIQQANNIPEEKRADWTIQNMLQLSKQEGLPVKQIGTALESLTQIDPQAPISPSVSTWMKYLIASDDQTIRMNVKSEKDQAMLFGMRDAIINSQGQDADKTMQTAISRGQAIRDNNVPLSTQQKNQVVSQTNNAVSQLRDPTQTTWYMRSESLPDSTEDYLKGRLSAETQKLYQVTNNIKQANDMAVKEFKQNNMILTGGVVANIGVKQLAGFVPDFAKGTDDAEVVQKKAVSALDYQVNNLLSSQSKADGMKYERDAVKVIFNNSGATYQVNIGGLSVGTFFTGNLKDQYNEDFFKKWTEEQDKQQGVSERSHQIKDVSGTQQQINMMMPKY
ncbi:MAG: hypothetical protein [Bacteriophage sp.]|nr:MAG: hypothetical protein [Bacteriophage sp.]